MLFCLDNRAGLFQKNLQLSYQGSCLIYETEPNTDLLRFSGIFWCKIVRIIGATKNFSVPSRSTSKAFQSILILKVLTCYPLA